MADLSPAAQAVLDAFLNGYICKPGCNVAFEADRNGIAAAIRAVADRMMYLIGDTYHPKYAEGIEAASDFVERIAAELEGANPDCGEEASLHERFMEAHHD